MFESRTPVTAALDIQQPLLRLIGPLANDDDAGPAATDELRYRRFAESLGVALYTTDAEGHLTYFNEAAVTLWGRRPELGELWCGSWRLFWPDGRPMAHEECPMAIALKENRPVRGQTAIAQRPDGTRVYFMPYPSPLQEPDGRLVGGVNVLIDVTDRQRAEQALESATQALVASNTARDDFLGLVSHELRTPVTTIFGNAQLLLDRLDRIPEPERDMVADIGVDAERLLAIVENLLVFNRLQAGADPELEPSLLRHMIRREIAAFMKRHPGRAISLTTPPYLVVVEADRTYLMLLVQNLLSNADKYGGLGPIDVVVDDDGVEARVAVRDRGLGIDGIPVENLFAPFFRSRDAQKAASGLGLGLAVCRRIIEAMGGRIWANPREGGGSEFGFALPLSPEPAEFLDGPERSRHRAGLPAGRGEPTVLLTRLSRLARIGTLPETRRAIGDIARSGALRDVAWLAANDRPALARTLRNPASAGNLLRRAVRHPATLELGTVGLAFVPGRWLPLGWAAGWALGRLGRRRHDPPNA